MNHGVGSLNELLGVIDRAMRRSYHVDSLLYAELFELRTKLEHEAARFDADADLSRARTERRLRIRVRA